MMVSRFFLRLIEVAMTKMQHVDEWHTYLYQKPLVVLGNGVINYPANGNEYCDRSAWRAPGRSRSKSRLLKAGFVCLSKASLYWDTSCQKLILLVIFI
jgi:hypothetical protein